MRHAKARILAPMHLRFTARGIYQSTVSYEFAIKQQRNVECASFTVLETMSESTPPTPEWQTATVRPEQKHFYTITDEGEKDLVFSIDIGTKVSALHQLKWRARTNTWFNESQPTKSACVSKLDILSSTSFSDTPGNAVIDLKCAEDWGSQDDYFLRWRHFQSRSLDFEQFTHSALTVPGITEDMMIVVDQLLSKVKKDYERTFVHGKYIAPYGLRCDGKDTDNTEKEDVTASFVCVPYFSFEHLDSETRRFSNNASPDRHPMRTLYQWQFHEESTRENDSSQVLRIGGDGNKDKYLHVPQFWCLTLGSEIIITSCHLSIEQLMASNIRKIPKPNDLNKHGMVHVKDPHQRQYFFPLEDCQSYFELVELISTQCLEDLGLDIDDCDIYLKPQTLLTASLWIDVTSRESPTLISITVVDKSADAKRLLITGVDEDSHTTSSSSNDEDDLEESESLQVAQKGWLIRTDDYEQDRGHHRTTISRQRDDPGRTGKTHSTPAQLKAIRRLNKVGLIVNDPDSLARKDVQGPNAKATVQMYKPAPKEDQGDTKKGNAVPSVQDETEKDKSSTPNSPGVNASENKSARPENQNSTDRPPQPDFVVRIKPFSMWDLQESLENRNSGKNTISTEDLAGLNQIMSSLESKLQGKDPTATLYPTEYGVENEFMSGRPYHETDGMSLSHLKDLEANMTKKYNAQQNLRSHHQSEHGTPSDTIGDQSDHVETTRNARNMESLEEHESEIYKSVELLTRLTQNIISCFAPIAYDHELMKKLWGALGSFIHVRYPALKGTVSGSDQIFLSYIPGSLPSRRTGIQNRIIARETTI